MRDHLKHYIDESKTAQVRGLRILLEYFYATEIFEKITRHQKIISVFGSARTIPHSSEYRIAHRVGSLLYRSGFAVVTGASRGIMQAANQGVADEMARQIVQSGKARTMSQARETKEYKKLLQQHSVGLSISLPFESQNNPFVGVSATFHYFMVRKFFFGSLSSGFIACEGGWGTRDELFEILTLVQTGKAPVMPIIYLSSNPKHLQDDTKHALSKGYISKDDLHLLKLVKTPDAAAREVIQFYRVVDRIVYDRHQNAHVHLKKELSRSQKKRVEQILKEDVQQKPEVTWKPRELFVSRFAPHSYGSLRRAINFINRT